MKKTIVCAALFIFSAAGWSYFDAGLNYTSGTDGYKGQDAYAKIGTGGFWVKPEYSSYEADGIDAYRKYSARIGFEKSLYTLSFAAGLTPEVENTLLGKYENKFAGADITFSLNPTSGGKTRMAGPNSGYGGHSASGVTQIDLGAGLNYTAHTSNSKDIGQLDASLFAGAKVLMAQISASYTASSYDKTLTLANAGLAMNQRLTGLNSYVVGYPKSNFNLKLDLLGYPMVTPFISYNKTKFKLSNIDDLNTYGLGAYLDFNMVGATVSWQTYKAGGDRNNFLSFSAGLKF